MAENNDIDKEAAEKLMLFNKEVKELRLIYEEQARKDKLIADEQAIKNKAIADEEEKIRFTNAAKEKRRDTLSEALILGVIFAFLAFIINSIFSINLYGLFFSIYVVILIYSAAMLYFYPDGVISRTTIDPNAINPPHSSYMKCPHCETVGQITTKKVNLKKGVSGGKAVAGLLTGGLSLLAVGLSREEKQTQAHCRKCGNTWHF
jgi:hypothetical protein